MTTTMRGRWIDHWEPDDESFWNSGGDKIARKNLVLSMFAEHLGFTPEKVAQRVRDWREVK